MAVTFLHFDVSVHAEENMLPTYEVKFLLDSFKVLNSDKLFKKDYRNLFDTGSKYETIGVLYLETEDRDFGNQGWINRIRIKDDAINLVKDKMPGKEDNWIYQNWGTDTIKNASKVGPLYYQKYQGEYEGKKVVVEIWPIENQTTGNVTYITELSFKSDTVEEAIGIRSSLMEYLDEQGILIREDSLKTQAIMDAYLGE